jgi:hypothetical protein
MTRWIHSWLERRRLRGRGLFRYHDGSRTRYADPAAIWRALLNHPAMDFSHDPQLADQGDPEAQPRVVQALSEIFAVPLFRDRAHPGLTTWEMLDLLRQFDEYLAALKKNTSPSRMPWQLLAYGSSTSTQPSPPAGPPATNSAADSCSTPDGSSTAAATTSCDPSPTP